MCRLSLSSSTHQVSPKDQEQAIHTIAPAHHDFYNQAYTPDHSWGLACARQLPQTDQRPALRAAGFEVHLPRLPSMNQSRPPNADLGSDTHLIRSYATSLIEAGRTIAVLMHSYGGHVGTNSLHGLCKGFRAAQGQQGGISHLIYMAAFALPEGKTMMDKVAEFGHMDRVPVAFGFDEDQSCVANYPKEGLIGEVYANELDKQELEAYIGSLLRWNGRCMYLPIQNTPAWSDEVRICYIYTVGDATVPVDYQRNVVEFLEKQGKTVETVELETGHCPNLTATQGVVDAVIEFTSH
ncbi:hypothetical protein diail_11915 [Diaporthe ilicicola]|nr:hypothetical protein diail_11915 [Diaporthe ilicicola]